MENTENDQEEVDALCKECGHAFKLYVDRLLSGYDTATEDKKIECPVCVCTDCKIGH